MGYTGIARYIPEHQILLVKAAMFFFLSIRNTDFSLVSFHLPERRNYFLSRFQNFSWSLDYHDPTCFRSIDCCLDTAKSRKNWTDLVLSVVLGTDDF